MDDPANFASTLSITQCVTLKLTSTNYLLWKTQFESFLCSQHLLGYVTRTLTRPLPTITIHEGDHLVESQNPDFFKWMDKDRLVMSWIYGSLSESALRIVYSLQSSYELWNALAKNFNRISASRKHELQRRLQTVTKRGKTMEDYLNSVKTVCDQLDSIGFPVENEDKIYSILNGLGNEYDSITNVIEGSMDSDPGPFLDDVVARLITYEDKRQNNDSVQDISPHIAFNAGRGYNTRAQGYNSNYGRGYNQNRGRNNNHGQSYGRGRNSNRNRGYYSTQGKGFHQQFNRDSSSDSNSRPTCQICGVVIRFHLPNCSYTLLFSRHLLREKLGGKS